MKISYQIIISALLIALPILIKSQNIQGVLILGGNLSQVDGDEVYGFKKPGLNVGAGASLPFGAKKKWAFNIETTYQQKGAFEKLPLEASDSLKLPYYDLRLHYAEIPIFVTFKDKNGLTFGSGLSYGRLTGIKEIEHGIDKRWDITNQPYKRSDFSIFCDLRFRLYKKIYFNFRYTYSVESIRTRTYQNQASTWSRDQYNNNLIFRLLFIFNEKSE